MDLSVRRTSPYIIIFEEPSSTGVDLIGRKSGEISGRIIGVNSTPDKTTYPKICVVGLTSPASVQVSCVTADEPNRPHPHKLIRCTEENHEESYAGIIKTQVRPHFPVAEFNDVKLQYIPREGIKQTLATRRVAQVNPFATADWDDSDLDRIDLSCLRLCFQVFIKNPNTGKVRGIIPVLSEPIYLQPPRQLDM